MYRYAAKYPFISANVPTVIVNLLPRLSNDYISNMKLYCIQQLQNKCFNVFNEIARKNQKTDGHNTKYTHVKRRKNRIRKPCWNISLNKMTEHCFGKCLDKTEQCSNWERRPLNVSQIEYAAMDAYILVKMLQYVKYET